jgi:YVTN family beta-propeller protein
MKHVGKFFLFLTFVIAVLARAAQADIRFNLENPSPNQTVSGISVISGWAFSTTPGAKVTAVTVTIDGQAFIIPCCVDRADVQAEFPDQPQALNSGFGQTYNYNLLTDGDHKITITVTDDKGGSASSSEQSFSVVRPGGFEVLSLLDILLSSPSITNQDNIAEQQIVLENVRAVQKDTNTSQTVKVHLAWQENTQSLGIVKSDNVGSATSTQTTQTAQTGEAQAAPGGQVQSSQETEPIAVNLENPPAQTTTGGTGTASGIGLVSGWAVSATDGATIASVKQRVDEVTTESSVPCCSQRADVAAAFNNRPEALNSGFGALVNFNLLPTGSHKIGVEVKDSTGATVTADNQITVVKLGGFDFIDQFDLSDAFVSTSNQTLIVDGVNVRDKATQVVAEGLLAHFMWQPSCQCFVAQAICGDGSVEPTEECDETDFAGETCESLGYSSGTLNCTDFCSYDTSACSGGPRIYVTVPNSDSSDDTVKVINMATNAVEGKPIKVGNEPRGLVISPDGTLAYVANFRDDTVSVINTGTNTVTATIQLRQGNGKKGPQGLAISCDGTRLYTVNGFDDSVSVVDTNTRSVIATVAVGHRPQRITLMPDGTRAYVTNNNEHSVSVLDLKANPITVITTIPVGKTPDGIAVSPDGKRVYVANTNVDDDVGEYSVSIIDTVTNTTVGEPLDVDFRPHRIAFSPDGTRAYVSNNASGTISVIDTAAESVINDLLTQDLPLGLVVTNAGKRLYVALFGNNGSGSEVEVTSTVTGGTVGLISSVGESPFEIALVPPVNFCTP